MSVSVFVCRPRQLLTLRLPPTSSAAVVLWSSADSSSSSCQMFISSRVQRGLTPRSPAACRCVDRVERSFLQGHTRETRWPPPDRRKESFVLGVTAVESSSDIASRKMWNRDPAAPQTLSCQSNAGANGRLWRDGFLHGVTANGPTTSTENSSAESVHIFSKICMSHVDINANHLVTKATHLHVSAVFQRCKSCES